MFGQSNAMSSGISLLKRLFPIVYQLSVFFVEYMMDIKSPKASKPLSVNFFTHFLDRLFFFKLYDGKTESKNSI